MQSSEAHIRAAVKDFWRSRRSAGERQAQADSADRGERGSVTSSKHLNAFAELLAGLVAETGVRAPSIRRRQRLVTLPGFFRPTKQWDFVVHSEDRLLAAVELKSHIGPSFGNNCNNRIEGALGGATDFWTAYREGAFGVSPPPFLGYFILVEDCPKVHQPPPRPPRASYFEVRPEFRDVTYAGRYRLLCEKLVLQKLYTAAALILSPRAAALDGDYTEASAETGLETFLNELRGKLSTAAARAEPVTVRVREDAPL